MTDVDVRPREIETTMREINADIQKLVAARSARAGSYGPQFVELWTLAVSCVGGGKLLRPRMLIGAFDALTDTPAPEAASRAVALEIAAALEILHFAFLLHDDVIDEDLVRRGEPNLIGRLANSATATQELTSDRPHAVQRRIHWARSSGLLVGDLMLTIAHQVFARARLPEERRIRILDLLDATVTETVAGEYCDVGLADGCINPDLSLVLEMTRMKTATYTFELPLRIAAVIAGQDQRVEQRLGEVGRHLGVAFQLQDDLLSAFGASEAHGKDQFSDFREGKETALIAYARKTHMWPHIEHHMSSVNFSDNSGYAIQRLLIDCGARVFIESMIEDQMRAALDILSQEDGVLPAHVSQFILTLVDSLDGRRS